MLLVRRGSLYGILHSPEVQLSWAQVAHLCLGAARGMLHLHSFNCLHRDLKSGMLHSDSGSAQPSSRHGSCKEWMAGGISFPDVRLCALSHSKAKEGKPFNPECLLMLLQYCTIQVHRSLQRPCCGLHQGLALTLVILSGYSH